MSTGYPSATTPQSTHQNTTRQNASSGSQHEEGFLTKRIEEQTAKLPSDFWLLAAGGSILGSLAFRMAGEAHKSLFVGQWAPTFLLLGIYNKMVKQNGSDGTRRRRES